MNPKVANFTFDIDNSNDQYSVINFFSTNNTNKPVVKLKQRLTISIPEDSKDESYGKILLQTSVDVCRMGSIQSNIAVKLFMENFANVSNFDLKSILLSFEISIQLIIFVYFQMSFEASKLDTDQFYVSSNKIV